MLFSQEAFTVKGKVIEDGTGSPIQEVVIVAEKSGATTTSDENGNYEIQLDTADRLNFSFFGMKNKTLDASAGGTIDISLSQDTESLVGYRHPKKGGCDRFCSLSKDKGFSCLSSIGCNTSYPRSCSGSSCSIK